MDVTQIIATLLLILCSGIAAIMTAKLTRLPFPLCVLIWGMVSSAVVPLTDFDTGVRADSFQYLIMFVLLPVLVFEAAINLKTEILRPVLPTIMFAATLGSVVATAVAAVILFYAIGYPNAFPWIAALLTGLLISATDPAAIVPQLRAANAPESLVTFLEGESVFNDATAIVLFGILLAMALGEAQTSFAAGTLQLVIVLAGGIGIGWVFAQFGKLVLYLCGKDTSTYMVTSLTLAYGSFYVAELLFEVSGVIAVLVAALFSKKALLCDEANQRHVPESWDLLVFFANLVVFYLMGLVVTYDMFTEQYLSMAFAIGAGFAARLVSCYLSLGIGKLVFKDALQWRHGPVMVWGGIRGVVTLALVLSLPVELEYWWIIQSMGFGVVLFTLSVQATTNPWLLKKLNLEP